MISRIKNEKYTNKKDETLDLIQDIGEKDQIKRWGLRGITRYADDIDFTVLKVENEKRNDD